MASVNDLLKVAYAEVGYAEAPVNRTKYGKYYGVDGSAWCGIFVNWVAEKAGVRVPHTFYTPSGYASFKKAGALFTKGDPLPGDVLYFDFLNDNLDRVSHTGFCVTSLPGGKVLTIEGNTTGSKPLAHKPGKSERNGGEVAVKIRNIQDIVGFGRPKYKKAPAPLVEELVAKYVSKPAPAKKATPKK